MQLDERFDQPEPQPNTAFAELIVARGVAKRVEAREKRLEEILLIVRGKPPRPWSRTETRTQSPAACSARTSRRIVPPSGVNLTALASRFVSTSKILEGIGFEWA